jgi:ribosome-associated translation inhibitor RaiA
MQIQINTDHNIEGHEALVTHLSSIVTKTFSHINDQITRVEVHVTDENGHKTGKNDKRCMMEARLENRLPLAVTCHAETVHKAVEGAAKKLIRSIESDLGRLHDQALRPDEMTPAEPTDKESPEV